jgi:hypothetical protein
MPGPSNNIKIYKDLVEFVLAQHRDLVSLERLNLFLGKSKKRYPHLNKIAIQDDFGLKLSEDFYDDEDAALRSLSVVIACAYKVLEMFLGSGTARDKVLSSVDKFKLLHKELDTPELRKYLPKRGDEKGTQEASEPEGDVENMQEGPDEHKDGPVTADDILRPKDEGLPFYDEVKKEWVTRPAHEVQKFKEEHAKVPGLEIPTAPTKKVDELPKDPLSWIQEEFDYGRCLMVEGTGQEKNMLCAQFLKEGLDAGDEVIAILGYSPKVFLSQLQKIGVMDKDLSRVHIIDWYTFKEKQVTETETQGNVIIVPKDPKFMGSALTAILSSIDKSKKRRAFIGIVSYALAFIDFETVYNFVQVTRLKFRKSKVMGLFTIEAGQHGKEVRDSFTDVSDGWIKVKEGLSGANTWKMKVDVSFKGSDKKALKDVVIMRNNMVVLERRAGAKDDNLGLGVEVEEEEEEIEEPAAPKPKPHDQYLVDKIEMWRGLGFSVKALEVAMDQGDDSVKEALQSFERKAGKALELRGRLDELGGRLKTLRDPTLDDEALEVRKGIKDLQDLDEMEKRITILESAIKERAEKESRRRDREKDIFRIRMEHWARQGYDTTRLEHIIDKDLEMVNTEFATFRAIVNRLKKMEEELDKMTLKGHELDVQAIKRRLFDVENVDDTEKMFNRIRESVMVKERILETAKGRRNELMDEMFQWALEGYCVDLIDQVDVFREDLATLEARLGRLRARIGRLKRMEETLNGLDLSAHKDEEKEVRAILKDVDKVDEVERRVLALQDKLKGKMGSEVMAIDANFEKVKELEETWQKLKARLLSQSRSDKGKDEKDTTG